MARSDIQFEFALHVCDLIQWCRAQGFKVTLGEAWRPDQVQEAHRRAGRSTVRRSRHQDRLAIDLNLFIDGRYQQRSEAYQPLGDYWTSLHPRNVWGGNWTTFPDGNHFERKP